MPEPEPKPDNPYVGPRPFERGDERRFFGRKNETSQLLSLITAQKALLVYAQSGAGKTSLINAKLIPWLQNEGFEVFPPTRVRYAAKDISLSDISNVYVFSALSGLLESGESPSGLVQTTFAKFLKRLPEHGKSPRVLIFDQFEELFTSLPGRWQDRKGFFEQLATALTDKDEGDPFLRAVFVMREDYIASLDPYVSLLPEKLRTRFRLERLGEKAALEAVVGPLEATTRHYGQGVAEKLVHDLQMTYALDEKGEYTPIVGEFIEPVHLQIVCERLWDELPDEVQEITAEHLKTSGDVDKALADFYSNVASQAASKTKISEGQVRDWVETRLITVAQTRGNVFRGQEETAGAPNALPEALEDLHLIRGELRGSGRWYELTHDRFIAPIRHSNRIWFSQHIFPLLTKWMKQHRPLVYSFSAASLVVVCAAIIYFHQVRKERDKAVAEKKAAFEVINWMEADLWGALAAAGKTELLQMVNDRGMRYLNEHPPKADDFEAHLLSAWAIYQKGILLAAKGQLDDALEQYDSTLMVLTEHSKKNQDDFDYQSLVCKTTAQIAAIHLARGDLRHASSRYDENVKLAEGLVQRGQDGTDKAYAQKTLLGGYEGVGDVRFYQGKLTDAIKNYQRCADIIVDLDDQSSMNRWRLSNTDANIANILSIEGRLNEARQVYEQGLRIANELIKEEPGNSASLRAASLNMSGVGDVVREQGQFEAARTAYDESWKISNTLAEQDPSNDWRRANVADNCGQIGNVLRDTGNLRGAFDYYSKALSVFEDLTDKDPKNVYWQEARATTQTRIAEVLCQQHKLEDALDASQEGLTILQNLETLDSSNAVWQNELATARKEIGDVLLDQGDPERALKNYQEAIAVRQKLVNLDDANASWKYNLSDSYNKIGKALQQRGDFSGALDNFCRGLSILEELSKLSADNENAVWQADLGYSYFHVGMAEAKIELNSKKEAQEMMIKGHDILRQLKERKALTAEQQGWLAEIEAELSKAKEVR